jgi:hypothetical protein
MEKSLVVDTKKIPIIKRVTKTISEDYGDDTPPPDPFI